MSCMFDDLWKDIDHLRKFIIHYKFSENPIFKQYSKDAVSNIHKFNLCMIKIVKLDPPYAKVFYYKNRGKLVRIYDTFQGSFAKTYMSLNERRVFESVINKLFKGVLGIHNVSQEFSFLPTMLFTKFIRGITYFENEKNLQARPVYHRVESCGVSDEKFKNGHNKSFLRMCFIERSIYNRIFSNIFGRQDVQHLNELQIVEKLYDQFLPGEFVNVEITFAKKIIPIRLQISWHNLHHKSVIVEKYRKSYDSKKDDYKELVSCSRTCIYSNGKIKEYEKMQSWDQETPWILVS